MMVDMTQERGTDMEIFKTKTQMHQWSKTVKKAGRTIGFVPTMGYLHQGHLSLLEKAKTLCDEVVLSIFVNPTQFGPTEDLDAYPSDIENDLALARKIGTNAVFLPEKSHIYPENFQTEVSLSRLPAFLCGRSRPIHFAGVATVVTKLFNIVMPDIAVFGQKDYQQLQIIRQLTADLDFDIEIVAGSIVREPDGLAMSSRNAYLTPSQRNAARSLYAALSLAEKMVADGEKNPAILQQKMGELISSFEQTAVEYIAICDPETLEPLSVIQNRFLLALAVKVGTTRLIDNAVMDLPQ